MKNKYSRTVIEIQESTDFLPIFETIDGIEMPYLPLPHKDYPLAKQLSGYRQILNDLIEIIEVLNNLIKEDFNHKNYLNELRKYCIILYGKCFAVGEGRGVKLDYSDLSNLDEANKLFHKFIIDLRNKYIAHAGINDSEKYLTYAVYNPMCNSENNKDLSIIYNSGMFPLYGKNLHTIKKMVLLCESVCLIVNQKYQKKYDKLMEIVSQDYVLAGFAKTKLERENALKNRLI